MNRIAATQSSQNILAGQGISRRAFLGGLAAAGAALLGLGLGVSGQPDLALAVDAKDASGSAKADSAAAEEPAVQGTLDSIKVAFVQLVDNDAFVRMIDGFKTGMKKAGYEEGVNATFDVKNAQGDTPTLNSIAIDLKNADYDVVVPIATPAAQACANAGLSCPVVFISVTDPVAAGIMEALDKPTLGVTGTSNVIPVDEIFKLADQLKTKDIATYGLLYCTGETNAVATIAKAKAYLDGEGKKYEEATVANSSEVAQAAAQLASKVDLIYIPVDSTVQAAMPQVVDAAAKAGIPVYGSDPVMVRSGALACVSVSNEELGERSAQMAVEITNGTPVEQVPAVTFDTFTPVVNKATAEALGVTLPDDGSMQIVEA
ncbi:MAG: ABC transporter substrate-binding protein [Coriobacteriia bacterium]|nr:ABC transporter substrate-binding protein [Coriobacteriia bacterium]MBS5477725.1 ABC transporter substrate-binding protein [Coriobacteriia bacterium]